MDMIIDNYLVTLPIMLRYKILKRTGEPGIKTGAFYERAEGHVHCCNRADVCCLERGCPMALVMPRSHIGSVHTSAGFGRALRQSTSASISLPA